MPELCALKRFLFALIFACPFSIFPFSPLVNETFCSKWFGGGIGEDLTHFLFLDMAGNKLMELPQFSG